MTQALRRRQLESIFEKLFKMYPQLLGNIYFRPGISAEQICGSISDEINKYLRSGLGVDSQEFNGYYHGIGTQHSGGSDGTGHCWVEFSYEDEHGRKHNVIIDGAYAQFLPDDAPMILKDKIRLSIFLDEPVAREWYKGNPMTGFTYKLNEKGLRIL